MPRNTARQPSRYCRLISTRVNAGDLVEFFVRIGQTVELPLFVYNFPDRTGNPITLDMLKCIAERTPLAGIKHSGGRFEFLSFLVALGKEKQFKVLTDGWITRSTKSPPPPWA